MHEVKVDSQFRLDLEGMLTVVRGAGLVFLNNPNNPTATVHGAKTITDFVERVRRISPDTVILIDEAYHDYVTDPEYSDGDSARARDAERVRRAHVLEGVRHGRHAHRLRDRPAGHDQAARAAEDAVQHQRLRHRGGDRGARTIRKHIDGRARAQHRGARRSR